MQDAYRPATFDEVVGQPTDEIEATLRAFDAPSFLFHGPPGTGKTATAHVIARYLQGSDSELMDFNSSDERGIDTVRDSINPAANQTTLSGAPRVIFLDEMEAMSKDAQEALRVPMEQSGAVFILACNNIDAVHDALQSRCHDFHFGALDPGAIRKRIRQLADAEGADLGGDDLKAIANYADGDMRKAIQRYGQVVRGAIENDVDSTLSRAAENLRD